jgi:hypothetical protein
MYYLVIGTKRTIAHDFGGGQQGRCGFGKQLQCGRAYSSRGNETVFSKSVKGIKCHKGNMDARRTEQQRPVHQEFGAGGFRETYEGVCGER